MDVRTRRTYSKEERDAAVQDVRTLGVCAAAKKHGIASACVSRWASEAGVRRLRRLEEQAVSTAVATVEPAVSDSKAVPGAATAADSVDGSPSRSIARLYTPSQKARALEFMATHGVTKTARELGISRFSLYQWRRQASAAATGAAPAPTSGPTPQQIEDQRDKEILNEWRKNVGLGPSQVVNQLRRAGVKVSVNTARRVMQGAGYRPPKVHREPHDRRYEAVRPNQLWHLDFVHRHVNRANTFTLILIDDYSRYVVGHGVDDAERADMVIETFSQTVERHGRPESVMHDKGSAFWSWRGISKFTHLLVELGVDQIVAEHKEWNGKVEVFNGNLHKELFDVRKFYDVAEMRRRLACHIEWYNHARTHHALGGLLVPADRYYGRVNEVLARIEAGAGRDPGDFLDLRERCLELFRITSRAGSPEVWLLGQKLFGTPK